MTVLMSWVHLSDIHFGHGGPGHTADQRLVLSSLKADVEQLAYRTVGKPTAILISGDIAFSAGDRHDAETSAGGEYRQAHNWLSEIAGILDVPLTRVLCVPGNHDVQRSVDKLSPVRRLMTRLRAGEETLDDALAEKADCEMLFSRFSNYRGFSANLHGTRAEEEPLWWSTRFEHAAASTQIVGLNSALLSAGDDDRGLLSIGKIQLSRTLEAPPSDGEIVIVMVHHPPAGGWLRDEPSFSNWVASRAHVLLSGHAHEASSVTMSFGHGGQLVRISAGASHGERLPPEVPQTHAYSVAALVLEEASVQLRVWPRKWSENAKTFRTDEDCVQDGDGFAVFRLTRVRPRSDAGNGLPSTDRTAQRLNTAVAAGKVPDIDVWDPRPHVAAEVLTEQIDLTAEALPELHWKLAVVLARTGRLPEAVERLSRGDALMRGGESYPERLLYGGFVLFRQGDLEKALELLVTYAGHPDATDRETSVAYDLLGSIERRRANVGAALDRLKASLSTKRRLRDEHGAALTLGNLGRLQLHIGDAKGAVESFQENLRLTDALSDNDKRGIVANNLAEALIEAGRFSDAEPLLAGVLRSEKRSKTDRGFALVLRGYLHILDGKIEEARSVLFDARALFEDAGFDDGIAAVDEMEGLVALFAGWVRTARVRFRLADEAASGGNETVYDIFRLRRRASVASQAGSNAIAMEFTMKAFGIARARNVPVIGALEEDKSRYARTVGAPPSIEMDEGRWLLHWRMRLPRMVAKRMPDSLENRLATFLFLEDVVDYLTLIAVAATQKGNGRPEGERAAFGLKLQHLRSLLLELEGRREALPSQELLLRLLSDAVALRNAYVHRGALDSDGKTVALVADVVTLIGGFKLIVVTRDGERELVGTTGEVPPGRLVFEAGRRIDAAAVLRAADGYLAWNASVFGGPAEWIREDGQKDVIQQDAAVSA